MSQIESVTPACWVWCQTSAAPLNHLVTAPQNMCSGGTLRALLVWSSSSSALFMPGMFKTLYRLYFLFKFVLIFLLNSLSLCISSVSVRPVTPRWTSWCRRRRAQVQVGRVWWERTAYAGPWTTKRRKSPTATPFSTSTSVWPHCTLWWLSPTGTSKCLSPTGCWTYNKHIRGPKVRE